MLWCSWIIRLVQLLCRHDWGTIALVRQFFQNLPGFFALGIWQPGTVMSPQAHAFEFFRLPIRPNRAARPAQLKHPPVRVFQVKGCNMVVNMATQGYAYAVWILQRHVISTPHIIKVVVFEHQMINFGRPAGMCQPDGVVPRIAMQKLHTERCLGMITELEAEYFPVHVADLIKVFGNQRHMAQPHIAGAETADWSSGNKLCSGIFQAMTDFNTNTIGIGKVQHVSHPAKVYFLAGALLNLVALFSQTAGQGFQIVAVVDLKAHPHGGSLIAAGNNETLNFFIHTQPDPLTGFHHFHLHANVPGSLLHPCIQLGRCYYDIAKILDHNFYLIVNSSAAPCYSAHMPPSTDNCEPVT